jgi:hypothetical protein
MKVGFYFLLFIPCLVQSQNILPQKDGAILYTGIIQVDSSASKSELYNRGKVWFINEFKSSNDVLQMQDKEAGILIGKGFFEIENGVNTQIWQTIKLYFKDGKYKYEITDLSMQSSIGGESYKRNVTNTSPGNNQNLYNDFLKKINIKILAEIFSLKENMNKPLNGNDF